MAPAPIYTLANCKFAYQLHWSLTLFWRIIPPNDQWIPELKVATEADGVRILRHRFGHSDCSQFLVSTTPEIAPSRIIWSVKGRLQHLLREKSPRAFRRNYDLQSVGSTKSGIVDAYVASQLQQHPQATDRLKDLFENLQIVDPDVDLLPPRFTAHGRCRCNLHIVLVHDSRSHETRQDVWVKVRDMIRRASRAKRHLLSRVAILPDHMHLVLGTNADEAPADVAISYMNNIAFARGMRPVLMYGCYLGGIGSYDLVAIRGD